jgi:peptidoglycan/xylan/chitin deacetylase (PgdA/CDA1 family)
MGSATITLAILLSQAAPRPAQPPVAIARVETKEPVVALTFDACATLDQPNAFDREVFDIIKREQIPATIFVSGRWIEFHPDQARELAADRTIEFGNHSYSHPTLTTVNATRLIDEIGRTEDLISQLGRHSVAFRPPAGVYSARTLKAAADRHLPTVLWDVVSGDVGGRLKPARMVDDVTRGVKPGSIVIFHINGRGPYTKDALPEIIKNLRQRGLRFVPLSQLLSLPGARALRAPTMPRGKEAKEAPKDAGKAG